MGCYKQNNSRNQQLLCRITFKRQRSFFIPSRCLQYILENGSNFELCRFLLHTIFRNILFFRAKLTSNILHFREKTDLNILYFRLTCLVNPYKIWILIYTKDLDFKDDILFIPIYMTSCI